MKRMNGRDWWIVSRGKKKQTVSLSSLRKSAKIKVKFVLHNEYERVKNLAVYAAKEFHGIHNIGD